MMENSVLHTKKTGIHRIEINDAKFDADFKTCEFKFICGFQHLKSVWKLTQRMNLYEVV